MTASTYNVREILCDHSDCFETVEGVNSRVTTLRKVARGSGWRCDGTGDWCPAHVDGDRLPERASVVWPCSEEMVAMLEAHGF